MRYTAIVFLMIASLSHGQDIRAHVRVDVSGVDIDTNQRMTGQHQDIYTNCVLVHPFSQDRIVAGEPDYSVNAYTTTQGTAGYRASWVTNGGGSYAFDGADDHMLAPLAAATGSVGSITAWINPTNNGVLTIWGSSDEALLTYYLRSYVLNNQLYVSQRNAGTEDRVGTTGTPISTNEWNFVVVQTDTAGTAFELYVNGIWQAKTVVTGADNGDWFNETTRRDNFTIAILKRSSLAFPFNGGIDDFRAYDRSLTTNEQYDAYLLEPTVANGGKR